MEIEWGVAGFRMDNIINIAKELEFTCQTVVIK